MLQKPKRPVGRRVRNPKGKRGHDEMPDADDEGHKEAEVEGPGDREGLEG